VVSKKVDYSNSLGQTAQALQSIANNCVPTLSNDRTIETLTTALEDKLSQLVNQLY
jgi:hypothetical protein